MQRRRTLLMMPRGIDTNPKITEYGKHWDRTFGSTSISANWCITEWYEVNQQSIVQTINGYIGADTSGITFQYFLSNGTTDWYYFNGTNPRTVTTRYGVGITSISFSIEIAQIDNSYAYCVETGQILFAGKNTIYYGHRNISELN